MKYMIKYGFLINEKLEILQWLFNSINIHFHFFVRGN
jgi:hypothetical protein